MRLATGFLVALVVCTWLGVAQAVVPSAPQTGACPQAAAKASACEKGTACNREAACSKAGETACATQKACNATATCQGKHGCESAACKDAVMATMFGKMVIGEDGNCEAGNCEAGNCNTGHCELSKACAALQACASEPGCETACASTKACCQNAAACKTVACEQAAGAETAACAKGACCNKSMACAAANACASSTNCASSTQCASATACANAAGCPATACAAAGECPQVIATDHASPCGGGNCCQAKAAKLAMASDEACGGAACNGGACDAPQWDSRNATARISREQFEHLNQAAQHLAAAGLTKEAACVQEMAAEVREELMELLTDNLAQMTAAIAELQEEIAALEGEDASDVAQADVACKKAQPQPRGHVAMAQPDAAPAKQVAVNVKVVEVNLTDLRNLGFDVQLFSKAEQPAGVAEVLHALQRENLAKVLAWPTVVTADGGSFEVKHQESGAHLDVRAKLLDGKHVRVDIHPRDHQPGASAEQVRNAQRHEIDTRFEMELGKTAVLSGHVQERMKTQKLVGLKSSETRHTREQMQTFFLVTPELVEAEQAVSAASHTEPNVKEHREGKLRVKSLHIFEAGPGEMVPNVRFARPTVAR